MNLLANLAVNKLAPENAVPRFTCALSPKRPFDAVGLISRRQRVQELLSAGVADRQVRARVAGALDTLPMGSAVSAAIVPLLAPFDPTGHLSVISMNGCRTGCAKFVPMFSARSRTPAANRRKLRFGRSRKSPV